MKKVGTKQLETKRLILRKFNIEDATDMYNNWGSDYETSKMLFWDQHKNVEETKDLIKFWLKEYEDEDTYRWVVELKDTKEIIGSIDVVKKNRFDNTCEIGYCYGSKYWGKGYASEALNEVSKYLFKEAEFRLVELKHISDNVASGKVMQKCGFKYDGNLRKRAINPQFNRVNDLSYYSKTLEEFLNETI